MKLFRKQVPAAPAANGSETFTRRKWGAGRIVGLSILILAAAWAIVVVSSSAAYVQALLHPTCLPSSSQRAGYQPVTLQTKSGISLNGWYRPPGNGIVILLLGGHGANRDAMLPEADLLGRHGYGALTLETRGCAGVMATLGYREVEDLEAMVDFAEKQAGVHKLGALGFSAGSATLIRGAARLPQIGAVVAEGNYINLYEEITAVPAAPLSLEWQIQRTVAVAYAITVGVWPGEVSPVGDLPAISPRPVLLIHGEKEIGRTRGQEQFAAAGEPKGLWVVPGAGHGEYLQLQPEEYEKRVVEFFDRYLKLTF